MSATDRDYTTYSDIVPGDRGNHDWAVRFDYTTGGSVGISQWDGETLKDRVLLSPAQVRALQEFLRESKDR